MKRFRYFSVLFFTLIASCGGTISESDFTKLVVAKLQELGPKLKISTVGSLELEYSDSVTGKPNKAYLNNAYQAYKNGENLSEVVDKFAKSSFESLTTVNPDLNNIVPVVKDDKYIEEVTANVKANGTSNQEIDFYSIPYVDGLVIMYAVDTPENIRYINKSNFEELGIPESELRTRAIQNLDRILPQTELHSGENVFMITADGNYESSLLLFDKMWVGLQGKVQGSIVAAIPSRDVLLFTDSSNSKGIAELRTRVQEIMENGTYTLTNTLFERTKNGWVKFAK